MVRFLRDGEQSSEIGCDHQEGMKSGFLRCLYWTDDCCVAHCPYLDWGWILSSTSELDLNDFKLETTSSDLELCNNIVYDPDTQDLILSCASRLGPGTAGLDWMYEGKYIDH